MRTRGTKAVITLSGKAAEIWIRIPKGMRSRLVSRLLEEAYFYGRLDLFLDESLGTETGREDKTGNVKTFGLTTTDDTGKSVSPEKIFGEKEIQEDAEEGRGLQEKKKKEISRNEEASTEAVDEKSDLDPEWLRELDRKISGLVNL